MKAASFAYERPGDLASLLARLAELEGRAKIVAGGQSLGPMLNLRLAEPKLLLDIAAIPELRRASLDGSTLVLGACVTHADIEDGRVPDVTGGAMAEVASGIAYRAVRNRGTIGGSLAHADPAADWVSALTALGAEVEIASATGRRRLPVDRFVTGALATALEPTEILLAVRVPAVPQGALWGFVKPSTKVGEFAHAIGAVLLEPAAGRGRAVMGAIERAPIMLTDARPLFGGRIGHDFAEVYDQDAAKELLRAAGIGDPVALHVHATVLGRAVAKATAKPDPDRLAEAA